MYGLKIIGIIVYKFYWFFVMIINGMFCVCRCGSDVVGRMNNVILFLFWCFCYGYLLVMLRFLNFVVRERGRLFCFFLKEGGIYG